MIANNVFPWKNCRAFPSASNKSIQPRHTFQQHSFNSIHQFCFPHFLTAQLRISRFDLQKHHALTATAKAHRSHARIQYLVINILKKMSFFISTHIKLADFNLFSSSFLSIAGKSCHLLILQGDMKAVISAKRQIPASLWKDHKESNNLSSEKNLNNEVNKIGATY